MTQSSIFIFYLIASRTTKYLQKHQHTKPDQFLQNLVDQTLLSGGPLNKTILLKVCVRTNRVLFNTDTAQKKKKAGGRRQSSKDSSAGGGGA